MCGIAGFTHRQRPAPPGRVHEVITTLAHRGPDRQGVFESAAISPGAARLKLIDLGGGDQPMASSGAAQEAGGAGGSRHLAQRYGDGAARFPGLVKALYIARRGEDLYWRSSARLWFDQKYYLADDILAKVDRMRHGAFDRGAAALFGPPPGGVRLLPSARLKIDGSRQKVMASIDALVRQHLERRANLGYHLWGLVILFLWMKKWRIQAAPLEESSRSEKMDNVRSVLDPI